MPLRKIDFISSVLELAEPVPFTVAILMVKSLTRVLFAGDIVVLGNPGFTRREHPGLVHGQRPVQFRLLHVPGRGRAALRAQAAVHAQILVLHHDAAGLRQARGHVQRLLEVLRRCLEARAQLRFLAVVVMVRQSTGQMSRHASHSMHSLALNTVWTPQLRQRCTSCSTCSAVKPSSTSMLSFLKRSLSDTCGISRRSTGE